jgi:hypothetical protein
MLADPWGLYSVAQVSEAHPQIPKSEVREWASDNPQLVRQVGGVYVFDVEAIQELRAQFGLDEDDDEEEDDVEEEDEDDDEGPEYEFDAGDTDDDDFDDA